MSIPFSFYMHFVQIEHFAAERGEKRRTENAEAFSVRISY
jgi:hypothetical protein